MMVVLLLQAECLCLKQLWQNLLVKLFHQNFNLLRTNTGFFETQKKNSLSEQALKVEMLICLEEFCVLTNQKTYATFMPPQPGSMYDPQRQDR